VECATSEEERGEMKSVLITGGAGYFGRQFTRRLLRDNLSERIVIYSRGEARQAEMRRHLEDDPRLRWIIGDVRDEARLRRAMYGVEIVLHAAALKRTDVCAYNVLECIETNVVGTANVVKASIDSGAKIAVLLNSDKSVRPSTNYGLSKALAGRIFQDGNNYSGESGTRFCSCLYGNISGSTGSVIPTWREILKVSDTVPVSHPDCTRFFMLASEAVDLVLFAIKTNEAGRVFIPQLPAYRVGDLAEAMGAKMRVVGLAADEKMHEEMRSGETSDKARRMTVEELRKETAYVYPS